MSVRLEDYGDVAAGLGEAAQEVLRASWQEAARVFSPAGLQRWLQAARGLHALGRGPELVASFIQAAPEVAREIGEDAVADLAQAAMTMASKTSGAVLTLVVNTAPLAARRLGDAALFGAYLKFLNQLLAQAPRGMRPMLEQLDRLLSQLTLGGLRRWAMWGAQAHRTDFDAQLRYFSLASPDALAVLQDERKGTLFVDVQRRIGMYLRALWARDFYMRPTSGDFETREGYRPYIEDWIIHLPDAWDDLEPAVVMPSPPPLSQGERGTLPSPSGRGAGGEGMPAATAGDPARGITGLEIYRAAAAHAAAHIAYTRAPLSAEALNPLQIAFIGLVEDARVEALACAAFPGLRQLWGALHRPLPAAEPSVGGLMDRLARALIDPTFDDPDPWVARGRELFAAAADRLGDNRVSWEIGVGLAHELALRRLPYNPRTDVVSAPYRDDNRFVWAFSEADAVSAGAPWVERQVRKRVNLMEFVNEIDVETAGDDAQEVWILSTELFPYEDQGVSYNAMEGRQPVADPVHYPEWDHAIGLERPSWCTLLEKRPRLGDPQDIAAIAERHKPLVSRLKYLIEAMQPQGVMRLRKQEDGDEIDLEAAVRAMIALRLGDTPDPRIAIRNIRRVRDLSVMVLLDLSESTNDTVAGTEQTVLQLAREATALLSDAMDRIGDPFAVHGFCSDGRHDVQYFRFKDFDSPWDDMARARLAGMSGQLSTRMGTALRHAGALLKQRPTSRRLLLVVTDGEPADIDVRDPQYLRQDAKKAVEDLAAAGVRSFCLSLDPRADQYVSRIFGPNQYAILDRVERLPERLPMLYFGLTR